MNLEYEKNNSPISNLKREKLDTSLRPQKMDEFIGQNKICKNFKIFINAAKKRDEALDHVLLYGPPGLGKTTLAKIIANELEVNFRPTSGPVIQRPGDLAALLTGLILWLYSWNFRIKKLDLNFRTIDLAVITVSQVFIFLISVFVIMTQSIYLIFR